MRRLPLLILAPVLAAAGSAPVAPPAEPLDLALRRAQAEQAAAEARAARLERAATQARGAAQELARRQAAALQQIEVAEARITSADTRLRLLIAAMELQRRQLAREQRPAAALVAGVALMAQRPPLLAVVDRASLDELVAVRILLDASLPVIRRRTAELAAELSRGERLRQSAEGARQQLARDRRQLLARRQAFAALEQEALARASASGGQAIASGDVALAAAEQAEQLGRTSASSAGAREIAAALAGEPAAPPGPAAAAHGYRGAPFVYALPAAATVVDGLGSVSASGVRSRGLTLATNQGSAVTVPADGIVRFSGPFRDYDGVLIIDHGGGWMTLLLNVFSTLRPGDRVRLGDRLGHALGRISVELSQNGRRVSPALIAGSSQTLSKSGKGG